MLSHKYNICYKLNNTEGIFKNNNYLFQDFHEHLMEIYCWRDIGTDTSAEYSAKWKCKEQKMCINLATSE